MNKEKSKLELLQREYGEYNNETIALDEEIKRLQERKKEIEDKRKELQEMIIEERSRFNSNFNLDDFIPVIASIISAHERKEYMAVKTSLISTAKRTLPAVSGKWLSVYEPQLKRDALMIISNENIKEDNIYYDYELEKLNKRDSIIVHKTKSVQFEKNKMKYSRIYDGNNKTLQFVDKIDYLYDADNEFMVEKSVFEDFDYVIKFIDFVIAYRIDCQLLDISMQDIENLKSKFIEENGLIEKKDKTKK